MNPHSVHLEDVSVVRRGRPILADVSLQVAAGSCCAVLGPNGSGKSTLLSRAGPPTVVIVSHHLDELPRAVDQVVLLKDGGVLADGPAGAVLTTANLSRLFDRRVQVFKNDGRYVASVQEK